MFKYCSGLVTSNEWEHIGLLSNFTTGHQPMGNVVQDTLGQDGKM